MYVGEIETGFKTDVDDATQNKTLTFFILQFEPQEWIGQSTYKYSILGWFWLASSSRLNYIYCMSLAVCSQACKRSGS